MQNIFNYIRKLKKNKHIVLGVAFDWGIRKGLDIFIQLSEKLDKEKYQIILIGTDDSIVAKLPEGIIGIGRTQNQEELALYYSLADVFVNPTREDNYPTVNLEALDCGTPVVTFAAGGSPEMLKQGTGVVVPVNDTKQLIKEICAVCEKRKCTNRKYILSCAKNFNMKDKFAEYMELYSHLLGVSR